MGKFSVIRKFTKKDKLHEFVSNNYLTDGFMFATGGIKDQFK